MKNLIPIILLFSLLTSCGTSKNAASSTREGVIQSSFFGNSFGITSSAVNRNMKDYDYLSYNRPSPPSAALIPLKGWRVKSHTTLSNKAFGGYNWESTCYLYDFKDRFFCIAFVQDFSKVEFATDRFNEIKKLLDEKYSPGDSTGDSVLYGNSNGRHALLSVVPGSNGQKWFCMLHYIDKELYLKDTKEARDEL